MIQHPGGNRSLTLDVTLVGDEGTELSWRIDLWNGTDEQPIVLDPESRRGETDLFSLLDPVPVEANCSDCGSIHALQISPDMPPGANATIVVEASNP